MPTVAHDRKRDSRAWLPRTAGGVAVLTLFAVVVLPAPVAVAATQTVANCNDSGPGSLRQAVANASPGDTISFNPSLSCSTIILTGGHFAISTDLTITGPGANVLAVRGDDADSVFQIGSGATVGVSGLTIEDATNAPAVVNGGTLTITADTLSGNNQGAIVNDATLSVFDSTLAHNGSVGTGGGILNEYKLAVNNSTIADNSAAFGGDIYNGGGANLSVVDGSYGLTGPPGFPDAPAGLDPRGWRTTGDRPKRSPSCPEA
jgi:hypothetical protein